MFLSREPSIQFGEPGRRAIHLEDYAATPGGVACRNRDINASVLEVHGTSAIDGGLHRCGREFRVGAVGANTPGMQAARTVRTEVISGPLSDQGGNHFMPACLASHDVGTHVTGGRTVDKC